MEAVVLETRGEVQSHVSRSVKMEIQVVFKCSHVNDLIWFLVKFTGLAPDYPDYF